MNLREQLKEILPKVLPKRPAESIKGTKLIEIVKRQLEQDYSDATLRYHFSVMSCDPTSPIAKVDQGQGYYLRSAQPPRSFLQEPRLRQGALAGFDSEPGSDTPEQLLLKFQAFYNRFDSKETSFVFPIRHASERDKGRGSYYWIVPDAIVITWHAGEPVDDGGVKLLPELLSLEEPGFRLTSVKIAGGIDAENYLRVFHQCLSTCLWAHAAELVIATEMLDEYVVEELRRLGQRHGVGVRQFAFTEDDLAEWGNPVSITKLTVEDFDRGLRDTARVQRITAARPKDRLDWDRIELIKTKYGAIEYLFRWLHHCRMHKTAITFSDYDHLNLDKS